ncbi:MAG TPA: WGR domain-containing protein [Kofleriaceae bacterium]|nr:WGR domain-containing protein [Kofleriaceae bacterium]
MPRYEFSEGSSSKFWEITLSGTSFTTTYGKIGAKGQTTLKTFGSAAEAKQEYEKLVAEKVKKGYALAGKAPKGGAVAPPPAKAAGKGAAAGKTPKTPKAPKPASEPAETPAGKPTSASGKPGARYFELVEGSSAKFWEILVEDAAVTTRYGKIGTAGQETLKEHDSKSGAFKEYDKLVAEKTKKGYREIGAGGAASEPRNPELEKAIEADPYDASAYSVLGHWLQGQGDPRGELIALSLAKKDKQAKALIQKHVDYFLGPLAEHQKTHDGDDAEALGWAYGYIHRLRLSHNHYADSEFEGSLAEILDLVLRHPSGRFLAEITFGFNNDPNEDDLQDLIDMLVKRAPPTIRKLHLGDYKFAGGGRVGMGGEDTEISWYSIGNLGKLWKAVPGLRTLITQGGSSESAMGGGLQLGKIELPNLAHAEFRTGGLEKANARAIATAAIPSIEFLNIWYGDDSYGGDATVKDVELLLGRADLPKLRHLGLMNSEFADKLPEALVKSKLLPQLRELDLSLGCMTDEGARVIAQHKAAFQHLEKLNLSLNYLSKAAIATLKGVAKSVDTSQQRADDDPEYRHPTVGE